MWWKQPTFQSQTRCQAPFGSRQVLVRRCGIRSFNLRRDARPLSAHVSRAVCIRVDRFQSQTRCQAPFGTISAGRCLWSLSVSISDEMPGPFRHARRPANVSREYGFNLRRDARPLSACIGLTSPNKLRTRFNLRRDARPLSAYDDLPGGDMPHASFQSQTRCQAPFGLRYSHCKMEVRWVSISDEMPGPFRRQSARASTKTRLAVSISDEMPGPFRLVKSVLI